MLAWDYQVSTTRGDAALDVTPQQFDALSSGAKPAAFFFTVGGCTTCDSMRPLWQQLSITYGGQVTFTEVRWGLGTNGLFEEYNVTSTPAFLLFQNGTMISRHNGAFSSPSGMVSFVSQTLGPASVGSTSAPASLASELTGDSPSVIIAVALGLGAFASPCVLPLLPGYVSVLLKKGEGSRLRIGLNSLTAFAAGASGVAAFGALFLVMGDTLWTYLDAGKIIIAFALIAFGLGSLLGIGLPGGLPRRLGSLSSSMARSGGIASYALFYAVASLGCSLPFVAGGILNILDGVGPYSMAVRLAGFALGFAVPLGAMTALTGSGLKLAASKLGSASLLLQRIGGVAMVGAAFLVLITI